MNAGGPAFPTLVESGMDQDTGNKIYRYVNEGMTLRDYFAAQSMMMIFVVADRNDSEISNEGMAKVAYHIADCMLAERAK